MHAYTNARGRRSHNTNPLFRARCFAYSMLMPRHPRFSHPIRVVREATGLLQKQFAELIGVSTSHLQAIENGIRAKNGISRRLAARFTREFGVLPGTFETAGVPAGSMIPRDSRGKPYSTHSYERFKTQRAARPVAHVAQLEELTLILHMLFEAARRSNCWDPMRSSFGSWLERCLKNFGLHAELSRVHADARRLRKDARRRAVYGEVSPVVACGLSQLLGSALIPRNFPLSAGTLPGRRTQAVARSDLHRDDWVTPTSTGAPGNSRRARGPSLMIPLGLPSR